MAPPRKESGGFSAWSRSHRQKHHKLCATLRGPPRWDGPGKGAWLVAQPKTLVPLLGSFFSPALYGRVPQIPQEHQGWPCSGTGLWAFCEAASFGGSHNCSSLHRRKSAVLEGGSSAPRQGFPFCLEGWCSLWAAPTLCSLWTLVSPSARASTLDVGLAGTSWEWREAGLPVAWLGSGTQCA